MKDRIEKILASIGGPIWRSVQSTKHAPLGGIVIGIVVIAALVVFVF